jgi:hypothetical protein
MFDKEKLSHLKEARQRWEVGVLAKTLSKAPESKAEFKTVSVHFHPPTTRSAPSRLLLRLQ